MAEDSRRTWADIIRGEAQRRGALTTADERLRWMQVLGGFSREQRTAFAAAAAESLMQSRESTRPPDDYVLTWRPALDAVWRGLQGDANAFKQIASVLADFYRGPYFHDDGPDGPAEADDNAATSAFYAAECFIHGCVDFALWAAERAIDEVAEAIQRDEGRGSDLRVIGPADAVRWELDPRMQAELHRQSARLGHLAEHQAGFGGAMAIRRALIKQLRDEGPSRYPVIGMRRQEPSTARRQKRVSSAGSMMNTFTRGSPGFTGRYLRLRTTPATDPGREHSGRSVWPRGGGRIRG